MKHERVKEIEHITPTAISNHLTETGEPFSKKRIQSRSPRKNQGQRCLPAVVLLLPCLNLLQPTRRILRFKCIYS